MPRRARRSCRLVLAIASQLSVYWRSKSRPSETNSSEVRRRICWRAPFSMSFVSFGPLRSGRLPTRARDRAWPPICLYLRDLGESRTVAADVSCRASYRRDAVAGSGCRSKTPPELAPCLASVQERALSACRSRPRPDARAREVALPLGRAPEGRNKRSAARAADRDEAESRFARRRLLRTPMPPARRKPSLLILPWRSSTCVFSCAMTPANSPRLAASARRVTKMNRRAGYA